MMKTNKQILALKKEALDLNIPIISDDTLAYIIGLINDNKVQNVLELGTATGYSAINMALAGPNVDTIERDLVNYEKAKENINSFKLNSKINAIYADILEYNAENQMYDLIFIDAAKAQYIKMFEKFQGNLLIEGVIICDNLNFHYLDPKKVSRHTRQLLKKVESFKVFLKENESFETIFLEIGDGISISRRRIK